MVVPFCRSDLLGGHHEIRALRGLITPLVRRVSFRRIRPNRPPRQVLTEIDSLRRMSKPTRNSGVI